jgi:isoleucyl-tRNA synthetase
MNFEICIINPDKTKVLNKKIEECALKIISKETKILINKNQINENSFSGYYDESVNVNNLIKEITECLDKYDAYKASLSIEDFFINDLSLWYIRRSRKRFHSAENSKEAMSTLYFVLLNSIYFQ